MTDLEKNYNDFSFGEMDRIVLQINTASFDNDGQFHVYNTQSSADISSQTCQGSSQGEFFVARATSDGFNESTTYPEVKGYLLDTGFFLSSNFFPDDYLCLINLPKSVTSLIRVKSFVENILEKPRNFEIIIKSESSPPDN